MAPVASISLRFILVIALRLQWMLLLKCLTVLSCREHTLMHCLYEFLDSILRDRELHQPPIWPPSRHHWSRYIRHRPFCAKKSATINDIIRSHLVFLKSVWLNLYEASKTIWQGIACFGVSKKEKRPTPGFMECHKAWGGRTRQAHQKREPCGQSNTHSTNQNHILFLSNTSSSATGGFEAAHHQRVIKFSFLESKIFHDEWHP